MPFLLKPCFKLRKKRKKIKKKSEIITPFNDITVQISPAENMLQAENKNTYRNNDGEDQNAANDNVLNQSSSNSTSNDDRTPSGSIFSYTDRNSNGNNEIFNESRMEGETSPCASHAHIFNNDDEQNVSHGHVLQESSSNPSSEDSKFPSDSGYNNPNLSEDNKISDGSRMEILQEGEPVSNQAANPHISNNDDDEQNVTHGNVLQESYSNSPSDDGGTPTEKGYKKQNLNEYNEILNESRMEILQEGEPPLDEDTYPHINNSDDKQLNLTHENILQATRSKSPSGDGRMPSESRYINMNSNEENETGIEILQEGESPLNQDILTHTNYNDDEGLKVTHCNALKESRLKSPSAAERIPSGSKCIDQNSNEENETFNERDVEILQEGESPTSQAKYLNIENNDDNQNDILSNVLEKSNSNSRSEDGRTSSRCRYINFNRNDYSETPNIMGMEIIEEDKHESCSVSEISLHDKEVIGDSSLQNFESKTSSNVSDSESNGSTDILNKITVRSDVFEIIEKIHALKSVSKKQSHKTKDKNVGNNENPINIEQTNEDICEKENSVKSVPDNLTTEATDHFVEKNLTFATPSVISSSEKIKDIELENDAQVKGKLVCPEMGDMIRGITEHEDKVPNENLQSTNEENKITEIPQVVQKENLSHIFPRKELSSCNQTKNTNEQNFAEFQVPEPNVKNVGASNFQNSCFSRGGVVVTDIIKRHVTEDSSVHDAVGLNNLCKAEECENVLYPSAGHACSTEYSSGEFVNDDSNLSKNSDNIEYTNLYKKSGNAIYMSGDFVCTTNNNSRSCEESDSSTYKIETSVCYKQSNSYTNDSWINVNSDIVRGLLLLESVPAQQDGNIPVDTYCTGKDKNDSEVIMSSNELPTSNVPQLLKSSSLCYVAEEENANLEVGLSKAMNQCLSQYSIVNKSQIIKEPNELSSSYLQKKFQSSSACYDSKEYNINVEETNTAETVCEAIKNELRENAMPVNNVNSNHISNREETQNLEINFQGNTDVVDSVRKDECQIKDVIDQKETDELKNKQNPKTGMQQDFEENENLFLKSIQNIPESRNETAEAMETAITNLISKENDDFNCRYTKDIHCNVEHLIAKKELDIKNELFNESHYKIQERENNVLSVINNQAHILTEEDPEGSNEFNSDDSYMDMNKRYVQSDPEHLYKRCNIPDDTDVMSDIEIYSKNDGYLRNEYMHRSNIDNHTNKEVEYNCEKNSLNTRNPKMIERNYILQQHKNDTCDDSHIFQTQLTSESYNNENKDNNVRKKTDQFLYIEDNENFSFFIDDLPVESSVVSEVNKCKNVNSDLMSFSDDFSLNKQTESFNVIKPYMENEINCYHRTYDYQKRNENTDLSKNSEDFNCENFSKVLNDAKLIFGINRIENEEEKNVSCNKSQTDTLKEPFKPIEFTSNYIESKFQNSEKYLPTPNRQHHRSLSKYSISSASESSGSSKLSLNEVIEEKLRETFIMSPFGDNKPGLDNEIAEDANSHKTVHSGLCHIKGNKVPKIRGEIKSRQALKRPKESIISRNTTSKHNGMLSNKETCSQLRGHYSKSDKELTAKDQHYKQKHQNVKLKSPRMIFTESDSDQFSDYAQYEGDFDHLLKAVSENSLQAKYCKNSNLERIEAGRRSSIEAFKRQKLQATADMTSNIRVIPIQREGSFEFKISTTENKDRSRKLGRKLRQPFVENTDGMIERNIERVKSFSQQKEIGNKKIFSRVKSEENKKLEVERKLIHRTLSSDSESDLSSEASSLNMTPVRKNILNASRAIRSPKNSYRSDQQDSPNTARCRTGPLMFAQGNLVAYVTKDEKTNTYEIKKGVKFYNAYSKRFKYKFFDSENVNFDQTESNAKKDYYANRATTPDGLKVKFDETFKRYAGRGRSNGELISYKRSTEWLRDAGVVGNELTAQEANDTFKCTAGMKVALNKGDYRYFLKKLSRLKRLNYNQVYERLCAASSNKGMTENSAVKNECRF